jgi:glutamate synthase (ferredoxin)
MFDVIYSSYCGAQIFEIYGLGKEVVDIAFCGSVSRVGGLNLDEVPKTLLVPVAWI